MGADNRSVWLTFRDALFLNFRDVGSDYRWIDARRFMVSGPSDDNTILAALISEARYDDGYAAPIQTEPGPPSGIHGPYRLDAITAASFVATDRSAAIAALDEWAFQFSELPESFREKYRKFIDDLLPSSHRFYRLPNLRATAQHDWGWVVGTSGFIEIVAISPSSSALTLLVASDD